MSAPVPPPPADDRAARAALAEAERTARDLATFDAMRDWLPALMAEYDRRGERLALVVDVQRTNQRVEEALRDQVKQLEAIAADRDHLAEKVSALSVEKQALADAYIGTHDAKQQERDRAREAIANRDSSINRLLGQVAAVRALADEWTRELLRWRGTPQNFARSTAEHLLGTHAADVRSALDDGPAEAPGPTCRYCGADCSEGRSWDGGDLYACVSCATARAVRGPAEAAEPATTGHRVETWNDSTGYGWRCTCGTGGDGLTDRDECAAIAVRHESEAGAPEPALLYVHDGNCCPDCFNGLATHAEPFEECPCSMAGVGEPDVDRYPRASSVSTTPTPAAMALIDDLLRPWAYGYPVNPGYAGRAAQYVSVATVADWNARRAALAGSTPKENDQ